MDENFIVDFGEVTRVTTEDFNKLNNRPSYAGELMTGDTDIPQVPSSVSELNNDSNYQTGAQVSEAIETETGAREAADTALDGRLTTVEGIAATALQPSSIDKVVMTDINVGANTSTTTFNLDASKQNLLTGATSSKQVSMPVASSTEAGIMNSATFDAVANNTANINALANGAVAITGLPSSPTQAQLTTAWENATGETSLMNRAGIYDVTNGKVWTYYTNDTTWHSTTNTTQVTINTFTNSSEGTIKGSTNVGQIFAEADGTGSVNGWDSLNDAVGNNSSDISDLQTAVDGKQDKLIAGTNINIAADGKTISATDTTYTAGNAIDITNGEISADIHPADFFTASDSISECGSNLSLDNTIATTLKSVELKGGTYQQTYSGANLYNYLDTQSVSGSGVSVDDDGWITATFNNTGSSTQYLSYYTNTLPLQTETDYAIAIEVKSVSGTGSLDAVTSYQGQFSSSVSYGLANLQAGSTYISTRTTKSDFTGAVYSLRTVIGFAAGQSGSVTFRISVLADTSITPENFIYQPYTGGIPAPSPSYPMPINVVTGEQMATVSDGVDSEVFAISLGSTELCKIGDYQDYIYKSGDDWYVHKAMGKITLDGSETWSATQMTNNWMYYTTNAGMAVVTSSQMPNIVSNYFSVTTTDGQWTSIAGSKSVTLSNTASPNTQIRFTVGDSTNKLADFKTWLSTHNTIVYYPLATPTDIQITDATLVTQLNAVAGAKSYNGQTNIAVTAAGVNLPAILCVEAYRKSLNGLLGVIERLGA